jgi:subfamily B ATP-binding cassette protein HlyB/CyaB
MTTCNTSLMQCLQAIARFHHCAIKTPDHPGITWPGLLTEANAHGLVGQYRHCSADALIKEELPAIALGVNGQGFILAAVREGEVLIHDPGNGRSEAWPLSQLARQWTGKLLVLRAEQGSMGPLARFDFTWFVPVLVEHRKWLGQVLLAAFALQVFALVSPLFFQAVMDKVLLHHTLHTLDVLVIALIAVAVLESSLSATRTYILEHTAARIDAKLGSQLYRHLLALPLPYFQARRCGHIVARLGEVETLRNFLCAQTLSACIDTVFFAVFTAVLFYLSPTLAVVVLCSLPLYVLLAVWLTPHLRQRLEQQARKSAEQQAFLLETLRGMDTLKTLAAEPQLKQRWARLQAHTLLASVRAGNTSTLMQEAVSLIGKLTTAAVLGVGAWLVIASSLSLGQLIAFNLIATRVAQPVQRLAQLWVQLQQAGIAMHRLADVLDTPREDHDASLVALPEVAGHIEFRDITFRYSPGQPPVLEHFNLVVQAGEVIGIQGPSGCGKSTLALLLQKLYVPERGQVLIDGIDLAGVQACSLRESVGVVVQESVLLSRTVRENIALNDPGAPLDTIVAVAKLAGAHEFILKLPRGYDTLLQEGGSSLSGGQRQRIALARTLFTNPKILIMDEATSALDAEAEQHILMNMPEICKGRTVLIIAHKAQALRVAGRVLLLKR